MFRSRNLVYAIVPFTTEDTEALCAEKLRTQRILYKESSSSLYFL